MCDFMVCMYVIIYHIFHHTQHRKERRLLLLPVNSEGSKQLVQLLCILVAGVHHIKPVIYGLDNFRFIVLMMEPETCCHC